MNVGYICNFSGSAGFHIRLLWQDLGQYYKPEDYGVANRELALFIVKESGAKLVDTSVLGGGRDLIRCLWTLNPKSLKVCKPLSQKEFSNFDLSLADPQWLIENLPKNCTKAPLDYKTEGNLDKIINLLPNTKVERQPPKVALDSVDMLAHRINKLTKEERERLIRQIL
jgi:hypothetical protein